VRVASGGAHLAPSVSQQRAFGRCEEVERARNRGIGLGGRHPASIARAVSTKVAVPPLKRASGSRIASALGQSNGPRGQLRVQALRPRRGLVGIGDGRRRERRHGGHGKRRRARLARAAARGVALRRVARGRRRCQFTRARRAAPAPKAGSPSFPSMVAACGARATRPCAGGGRSAAASGASPEPSPSDSASRPPCWLWPCAMLPARLFWDLGGFDEDLVMALTSRCASGTLGAGSSGLRRSCSPTIAPRRGATSAGRPTSSGSGSAGSRSCAATYENERVDGECEERTPTSPVSHPPQARIRTASSELPIGAIRLSRTDTVPAA